MTRAAIALLLIQPHALGDIAWIWSRGRRLHGLSAKERSGERDGNEEP